MENDLQIGAHYLSLHLHFVGWQPDRVSRLVMLALLSRNACIINSTIHPLFTQFSGKFSLLECEYNLSSRKYFEILQFCTLTISYLTSRLPPHASRAKPPFPSHKLYMRPHPLPPPTSSSPSLHLKHCTQKVPLIELENYNDGNLIILASPNRFCL